MKVILVGPAFRDPVTRQVLPVGVAIDVPETVFWNRRIRAGDVVLQSPEPPTGLEPVAPLTTR